MNLSKRKIKFNEQDYIEKHYIKGENAVIPIKIEKISQFYNNYDLKELTMNDELTKYIDNITYLIPVSYSITLEFHTPQLSEEEQRKIKKMIKMNYSMDIDDIEYSMKINFWKTMTLLTIGLSLLIITYLISSYIWTIATECLTIAASVAIWNAVETLLLENSSLKYKKNDSLQLYDAKVIFIFDK